jgi:hypothetical protein
MKRFIGISSINKYKRIKLKKKEDGVLLLLFVSKKKENKNNIKLCIIFNWAE